MLRILFYLVFIIGMQHSLIAQNKSDSISRKHRKQESIKRDSINRANTRSLQTSVILKFHWAGSYCNLDNRASGLNMKSGWGTGAEFQIGYKAHQFVSVCFGLNVIDYDFDNPKLQSSVLNIPDKSVYSSIVAASSTTSLTKTGVFVQSSYWHYQPKSVLECYARLSLTNVHTNIDYLIFRRLPNSHYTEYDTYKGINNLVGFMPSLGLSYSARLWKLMYFTCSGEYGYNFTSINKITETSRNSYGEQFQRELIAPTPTHFLQLNAGLMLRPFNRVRSSEKEYKEPLFSEINRKNN